MNNPDFEHLMDTPDMDAEYDGYDERDDNRCPKCKGTGKSWDRLLECDACGGDGYIE